MKIKFMEVFGILPQIIELWEKGYGPELLPIQERAIKECGVLEGKSVVVLGATSSGKTFIAEMAAVQRACRKEKVIYAVSLKSLAEEKYRQFQKTYGEYGIRIAISHRDRREYDESIEQGHFEIAIVVYEKLHGLLIRNPDLLREVRLVIIDELQMLGDEERGADLEMLLSMVVNTKTELPLQLIGLSAVLSNADEIARWLKTQLLEHYARPVELRKGILCNGIYQYREHNTGVVGQEFFFSNTSSDNGIQQYYKLLPWQSAPLPDPYHEKSISDTVKYLAEGQEESTLIFVPTKAISRRWAESYSEISHLLPAQKIIQSLQSMEENTARVILSKTLQHGVAYHNADLPMELRELIESGFQSGQIRVLFATGTLGQGLNFATKNTIIVPEVFRYSTKNGGMLTYSIPRSQLENQGGRAGRYGYFENFGRMILIAQSEHEKTTLWVRYMGDTEQRVGSSRHHFSFEPLHPALAQAGWASSILRLIASGRCKTVGEVEEFFKMTLSARYINTQSIATGESLQGKVKTALEELASADLILRYTDGSLLINEYGLVCATTGTQIQTMNWIRKWISYFDGDTVIPLELLLVLGLTEDAIQFRIPIRDSEIRSNIHRSQLFKRANDQNINPEKIIMPLMKEPVSQSKDKVSYMKKALLLDDWLTEIETAEVERKYNLHSGMIRLLAGDYSWLVRAFTACGTLSGWPENKIRKFEQIAERLVYGVKETGILFTRLHIPELTRNHIHAIVHAGFNNPQSLKEVSILELSKIIPESLAEKLISYLSIESNKLKENPQSITNYAKDRIHLLGKPVKRRTAIVFNNKEIELMNSSYLVLLILARALRDRDTGNPNSGWVYRDELDNSDQWRNISRLRQSLAPHLVDPKEPVIENDGSGYYRLRIHPENLSIDEEVHAIHWNHALHPAEMVIEGEVRR